MAEEWGKGDYPVWGKKRQPVIIIREGLESLEKSKVRGFFVAEKSSTTLVNTVVVTKIVTSFRDEIHWERDGGSRGKGEGVEDDGIYQLEDNGGYMGTMYSDATSVILLGAKNISLS